MKHYKFDKKDGLIDETGKQILQIVKCDCSEKFRVMAGRELAKQLNYIAQGEIDHTMDLSELLDVLINVLQKQDLEILREEEGYMLEAATKLKNIIETKGKLCE